MKAGKRSVWRRGLGRANRLLHQQVYPLAGCEVAVAPVRARHRTGSPARSRAGDFELGLALPRRTLELGPYVPYCADYAARQLYLTRLPEGSGREAPFLYLAQRRFADAVAIVGLDRLGGLIPPAEPAHRDPLLLFSTGRCGSTLVSRLLDEAGVRAFSEPEAMSQLGGEPRNSGAAPDDPRARADRRLVVQATVRALERRAGERAVVVKTRSEANFHFCEITEALPRADCVFMFRGVEGWARSWIAAFQEDPETMSRLLLVCIAALERASERGMAPRVVWYEDVVADPAAACRTILGPGRTVAAEADFSRVMARDSQEGTEIASRLLDARRRDSRAEIAGRTAGFLRHWRSVQPRARIEALGLDPLMA